MKRELQKKVEGLLLAGDYAGALSALCSDPTVDAATVSLKVQVLRAAGRPRDAASLLEDQWNLISSEEDSLLRSLPAVLATEGWTPRTQARLEGAVRRHPRSTRLVSALFDLKCLVQDDARYLAWLLALAKPAGAADLVSELESELATDLPIPRLPVTDAVIGRILRLFSGLDGVHAVQTRMQDQWGYVPVRQSLDPAAVYRHLSGAQTLGVYPLRRDGTVWFAAIDVDVKKTHLDALASDLYRSGLLQAVERVTSSLAAALTELGLTPTLEYSGYKGFHLWVFFDEPVEAAGVRKLLKSATSSVALPDCVALEVFPKQDQLKDGQIGNLIKLPCGLHRRSNRYSCLLDPSTLRPAADQEQALTSIQRLSRHNVSAVLARVEPPSVTGSLLTDDEGRPAKVEFVGPMPSEVAVLGPTPHAVTRILEGCALVKAVVDSAESARSLTEAEAHVLTYVMGVLGDPGHTFVHRTLHRCAGYDPGKVNVRLGAVPPNPMSCAKVRKWLPEHARSLGCRCTLRCPEHAYPSPLIHAGIFPRSDEKVAHAPLRPQPPSPPMPVQPPLPALPPAPGALVDDLLGEFAAQHQHLAELRSKLEELFAHSDGVAVGVEGRLYRRRVAATGEVRYEVVGPDQLDG